MSTTITGILFDYSLSGVNHLLEFHEEVGGKGPGKREYRLQTLNKSAVVLLCAAWEAYVEDVIKEVALLKIDTAKSPGDLPLSIRKLLVRTIAKDKNELAALSLAGEGWKKVAEDGIVTVTKALNTPKTAQVSGLFAEALGIESLSDNWYWQKCTSTRASERLDAFVTLRGAIAHGAKDTSVSKLNVTEGLDLVQHLVERTEGALKDLGYAKAH